MRIYIFSISIYILSYNNYQWFWIPLIGPLIGGLIGGWMYRVFVGWHIHSINDNDRNRRHASIDDTNDDEFSKPLNSDIV